jgi:hypothetical protein
MTDTRTLSDEDIRTVWPQQPSAAQPVARADDDDDDDTTDTDTTDSDADTTDSGDTGDDA